MKKTIRIGTRGSPLALIQSEEIRKTLFRANPQLAADTEIEIVPIRTTGDWKPEHMEKRFVEMGGSKGLFTKEIEDALLSGHIDMAVHSMKDVASELSDRLDIAAVLPRNDPRDAFISATAPTLAELPQGAIIGTASLRRQAQILARRPDLRVVPLRGNVETRLKKLGDGLADATLLAVAGLARLDMTSRIASILSLDEMMPAAAQGALGVEIRKDDDEIRGLLAAINDPVSATCIRAERAVMAAIDGSCHTPAGAYATLGADGQVKINALVARANGQNMLRLSGTCATADAEALGKQIGDKLRADSPADLFAA
jgi:hydroxymethylbilane synthase